ncbi:hypothetical protein ACQJ65_01765 [Helicobacter pylori]
MRQEHETATSFNELKEITQTMRALKNGAPKNATNQESDRTQASANAKAHTPKRTQKTTLKPKATTQAKKARLNPTKKAFSERQKTAFRDNSQARAKTSFKTKASHNTNAFKTEQGLNSSLATHQEKVGSNE